MPEETTPSAAPVATGTPMVTFVENSVTCASAPGMTLRKLAKKNGVAIQTGPAAWANCQGFGLCGTCRVSVDPATAVNAPTFFERFTLGKDAGKLRLACQTTPIDTVNVKIKPAVDYAEVYRNVLVQSTMIGAFSLVMLVFLVAMLLDIVGMPF